MKPVIYISGRLVRTPKPSSNYFKVATFGYAAFFPFCSADAEEVHVAYGRALSCRDEVHGKISVYTREGGVNALSALDIVGEATLGDVVAEGGDVIQLPKRGPGRPPKSEAVAVMAPHTRFRGMA